MQQTMPPALRGNKRDQGVANTPGHSWGWGRTSPTRLGAELTKRLEVLTRNHSAVTPGCRVLGVERKCEGGNLAALPGVVDQARGIRPLPAARLRRHLAAATIERGHALGLDVPPTLLARADEVIE